MTSYAAVRRDWYRCSGSSFPATVIVEPAPARRRDVQYPRRKLRCGYREESCERAQSHRELAAPHPSLSFNGEASNQYKVTVPPPSVFRPTVTHVSGQPRQHGR